MKILHIISSLSTGGAESVLSQFATHPISLKDKQRIVTLGELGKIGEKLKAQNIKVDALNIEPNKLFSWRKLKRLAEIIEIYKPDIILTWMYHSNLLGGIIAKLKTKAPIVWTIHIDISDTSWIKLRTRLIIKLCALVSKLIPSKIIFVSEKSVASHTNVGFAKDNIVVIQNGFDSKIFSPNLAARNDLRKELNLKPSAKLVGFFARFDLEKDHKTFIQSANILQEEYPGVHFVLCGRDVDHKNHDLARLIDRNKMRDFFHLLGERDDMPRLYAGLDIYSISSISEGFPLSVGEAMATAVPCVVTDVGDTGFLVGNTGIIITSQNPRLLAKGWATYLSKNSVELTEIGARARSRIIKHFGIDNMVSRYYRIIDDFFEN